MDSSEHLSSEKKILKLSFFGSFISLLCEFIAVIFTGSQAILIDCTYDFADLIMLLPFMILVPRLYKPISEKWPYGLAQLEPIFVIIRCCILLFLDSVFLVDSIKMLLSGGHVVNATTVASFEFGMALSCLLFYLILKRLSKGFITPTLESELYVWKVDAFSTAGVGLAFVVQLLLKHTALSWITPYIDPAIAIILAIVLIPEPIVMIKDSIKSLILTAPKSDVIENVRNISIAAFEKHQLSVSFIDIVQTGRKTWVGIYIIGNQDNETISFTDLIEAKTEINDKIYSIFDDVNIEIIPDLE